ncbi:MAG TPA: SpoIIE family protein phosphatase [Candidatus Dormibacteraeota bacterium]|jgi:hypothetical protein|nr:SpoIIE family protein phosphatase [Candidatus Dormibacteraeota bacterium]
MAAARAERAGALEWAVAARPLAGQAVSGDLHLVRRFPGGTLLAVVDALGHGPPAAEVAASAVRSLAENPGRSPEDLAAACHRALLGSRGAILALASVSDGGRLTWLGVGNIEATLVSPGLAKTSLVPRAGIVGAGLPRLRPATLALLPGDLLAFTTDGIREGGVEAIAGHASPQEAAAWLLETRGRESDDALVLVARFTGGVAG